MSYPDLRDLSLGTETLSGITGADNATIRVTAMDDITVRLEMDYDGDGAVDEIVDLTWDEAIG